MQQKKSKKITERQILEQITQSKVKWIRLQFCNPFGLLHQLSVPAKAITKESFVKGFPLDGSSVLGFTDINKSDILLLPDPATFVILPDYFDTTNHDEKNQYHGCGGPTQPTGRNFSPISWRKFGYYLIFMWLQIFRVIALSVGNSF